MSAPTLYIAGTGMVTALGANTAMTSAGINAGISAYQDSGFNTPEGNSIVTTAIPRQLIQECELEIDMCDNYNQQFDNIIKISILSLLEACSYCTTKSPIPLFLTMADPAQQADALPYSALISNITRHISHITPALTKVSAHGRAAGMVALDLAFKALAQGDYDYCLVGGSDSHNHYSRLNPLAKDKRLLIEGSSNSFCPGEGSGFLLLTSKPELALKINGKSVVVHTPGLAKEAGHLFSPSPYQGNGLDTAFKKALTRQPQASISAIYSSMNGENHWAKEYGVATIRNSQYFEEGYRLEHPADCLGDLGAATATVLTALAAEDLFEQPLPSRHLVYSASDNAPRGAVVLESIHAA